MQRFWKQLAIATNWPVLAAMVVLSAIGVISIWGYDAGDGKKQLVFLCVGLVAMFAFQAVDYRKIGRFAWAFYIGAMVLILYTLVGSMVRVPGVKPINGACAWISFGSGARQFSLQPAELMKIGWCMVLARYLRFGESYRTIGGLMAPFALSLLPVAMILKQPDLGTALTFLPAMFVMLYIAGARMGHLLAVVGLGVVMAPLLWFSGHCPRDGCTICPRVAVVRHLPQFVKHYQRERVYAMFSDDPAVLQEAGYQQEHALIALGSGGIAGKGMGNIPVGRYVPESYNDMIFSLVGEQFGFFGVAVVLAAYVVLFAAGIEIAASTREPFGRLLAVGVVTLLAGQAFLNVMVALKVFPVTGITLPFVSYGGSSLLASCMAAGLLLNIGQVRPVVMARDSFEFR